MTFDIFQINSDVTTGQLFILVPKFVNI